MPADTVAVLEMPGGGGYGAPWLRDPALVLEDVRHEYVSKEQALEAYGVVIDTDSWTVDEAATARRRAGLATHT